LIKLEHRRRKNPLSGDRGAPKRKAKGKKEKNAAVTKTGAFRRIPEDLVEGGKIVVDPPTLVYVTERPGIFKGRGSCAPNRGLTAYRLDGTPEPRDGRHSQSETSLRRNSW